MAVNAYYGITVTLTDTNAHQLLALLLAIDSTLADLLQNCAMLQIQADDSNGGNASSAVYIGDANVSATRMAYQLTVHEANPYRLGLAQGIPLGCIYVRASGAGTYKLNVEVVM